MSKLITLDNGVKIRVVPVAGTTAATVLILFKIGSRNEEKKVWGGSHFIEHLMFKGTKRRPTTLDISKELDRFGAEYNAYTGKDLTGYYIKVDSSKLTTALDLLEDMLFHSKFAPAEMVKEKRVIVEEIKMYEENPIMHLEDLAEEAVFEGYILGRNIAGTAKSVLTMKRSDVLAYRDSFYRADNLLITVAGNFSAKTVDQIKKLFSKLPKAKIGIPKPELVNWEKLQGGAVRVQNKPVEQIQFAAIWPMFGKSHPDYFAAVLLAKILGGTMSSKLFVEVREKRGLCYTIRASVEGYEEAGAFMIRAGLDAARLKLAAQVIERVVLQVVKGGITPAELKLAKDNIKGGLKLHLEDSSAMAEFYGRQELLYGEALTPDGFLAKFDEVSLVQIKKVAALILRADKRSLAAIGPYANAGALLKEVVSTKTKV